MWWARKRLGTREGREVVAEAERLLSGTTILGYVRAIGRAPAWTLVSILGHCTRGELHRIASPAASPDPHGWSGAVAYLAEKILSQSYDDAELVRLQRSTLIPLELDLLGGKLRAPRTPADLYGLVSGVLGRPLSPEV